MPLPERPKIPANLLGNLPFLDLYGHLGPISQPGPVNLRDRGRGPRLLLHGSKSRLAGEGDAKHLLWTCAKVLPYDPLHIGPVVLWCIVKHPRKHGLELRGQNRALHGDSLADLQVQPAILMQQVGEPFGTPSMKILDRATQQRTRSEIKLVVCRNEYA